MTYEYWVSEIKEKVGCGEEYRTDVTSELNRKSDEGFELVELRVLKPEKLLTHGIYFILMRREVKRGRGRPKKTLE